MRAKCAAAGLLTLVIVAGLGVYVARPSRGSPVGKEIPIGAHPIAIAVDESTERAFIINSEDNTVSIISTATGRPIVTIPVAIGPIALATDAHARQVFVLSSGLQTQIQGQYVSHAMTSKSAMVSALGSDTGRVLWATPVGTTPTNIIVDPQRDRVFVNDFGFPTPNHTFSRGGINVLDATTGRLLHRVVVGFPDPFHIAVDTATDHVFVEGSALSLLDEATLRPLQVTGLAASPGVLLVDGRAHRLCVLDPSNARVTIIDTRNGNLVSTTVSLGTHPTAATVDRRNGHVFVVEGGLPGRVGMFREADGRLLRVTPVGSDPQAIAIDAYSNRAIVANRMSGTATIFDTRTGRIIHIVPVGRDPIAVAIDARTHHAFVVNAIGHAAARHDEWAWLPQWLRAPLPFIRPQSATSTMPAGSVTVVDMSR